jgi:cell division protein FtsL
VRLEEHVRSTRATARPLEPPRPVVEPAPEPDEPRHLKPVPDNFRTPKARRRRARWFVFGGVVVLAAVLFGVVAFHVTLTQSQLQLDNLKAQVQKQQDLNDRTRLQVSQLESPDRIVQAAQERGMVVPNNVTYLSPSAKP